MAFVKLEVVDRSSWDGGWAVSVRGMAGADQVEVVDLESNVAPAHVTGDIPNDSDGRKQTKADSHNR